MKLIVISGLPGVGKSTLAEGIARSLMIPILSVDPVESSIIKSGFKRSFDTGLAAYLIVETLAAEQLKLGLSVVIDAVSPVREARDMWHSLSNKYSAQLYIIECVLDERTHEERIRARVRGIHGIPEVTWQDVEERKKEYLDWGEERLVIDASKNIENNLAEAITYINK